MLCQISPSLSLSIFSIFSLSLSLSLSLFLCHWALGRLSWDKGYRIEGDRDLITAEYDIYTEEGITFSHKTNSPSWGWLVLCPKEQYDVDLN